MRIFGSDRISGLMQRLGMEEGVPIEAGMVTKAIERAQKQVEAQNFSVRKNLLEYDDVMNKQRESIYALRRDILEGTIRIDEGETVDTREYLNSLAEESLDTLVDTYAPADGDWNTDPPKHGLCESVPAATEAYQALQVWCDEENKTRRSPSSVASEGHFVVWLEAWPAEHSPARKPYYC